MYPTGNRKTRCRSPLGRLLQSTDPYGVVTTQTWDWRGRILSRTVAAGLPEAQTTAYAYDPSGKLIETDNHDGTKLYYDYDIANRLIRLRDTDGNRIDYSLDAMNHKTAESVYDPQGSLRRASSRVVDPFGTLTEERVRWVERSETHAEALREHTFGRRTSPFPLTQALSPL
ncbi:MAG: hypothetical protein LBB65_04265 [Burkholderiales bacterium]|nr:hypothetical protein [Burkholderiales bacterium]